MAKFNPNMLIPASQVEGLSATGNTRSQADVALANIEKMRGQWAAVQKGEKPEGKSHVRLVNGLAVFTIRISNKPLVLSHTQKLDHEQKPVLDGDKKPVLEEQREMTVPAGVFLEALDHYVQQIKGGAFDEQLSNLQEQRSARNDKMRATRAAKKEAKPA